MAMAAMMDTSVGAGGRRWRQRGRGDDLENIRVQHRHQHRAGESKGNAQSFPPKYFYSGGNVFFQLSEFGKKGQTSNKEDFSGPMPTIFSEIYEFGDHHPMLNHSQHGVMVSDFQFWSIFGYFLLKKKTASAKRPTTQP